MSDYHYQTGRRPEYKSRMERQIGDYLASRRIPFIYEKPTAVIDSGKLKVWYPDFSLKCGLVIEYFGITGDPQYLASARHKLRVYHENQFDVIPLYPADIVPEWANNLMRRMDTVLEGRLNDIRSSSLAG